MPEVRKPMFDMKYCVRCCMPETEEGYNDDERRICRVCRSSEQKMHIDWAEKERKLREICERAKVRAGNNYDCILPISGGKDSTFQMHVLCKVYNMRPLAVTFNHNWYSETGWYNLMNCLETFNVDHIMFSPNRDLVNRLAKRSLHTIGDVCWCCHSGCGAFPTHIAIKFNIPVIVFGESVAEVTQRGEYNELFEYDKNYYTTFSAKKTPDEMVCEYISRRDVHMFQLPSDEEYSNANIEFIHLGDYIFWDDERQMEFVRDTYGWRETDMENAYKGYKSAECIMPGLHDFTCYLKRGWARASFHASLDVRNGLLSRAEGFELIRRIDPQRPEALDYFKKITGMTEEEFYAVMKAHREPQLRDVEIPVIDKERPNRERILPYPQQVIERLKRKKPPFYEDESLAGEAPRPELSEMSADEVYNMSVNELIEGYRNRLFSPTDVAKAFIDRIEELEKDVLAWEVFEPEKLMSHAEEIENYLCSGGSIRLMEGIPVGVKDIFNTADYPTQMGSPLWKDFSPGNDARVVFNIKRAGGIAAGKTVTAEFGVHALNKTLNPHDRTRTPGTSSSGSAAAVAMGMVPVAIGTQTAASIIRPASFCGIYGCKPSFGLIPRTGTLKTTDTLDTVGFFVRYLEDIERVFNSLRVHGSNYPFNYKALSDPTKQTKPVERPWRVGFARTHTWQYAPDYAREALLGWVRKLAGIREIEMIEAELPSEMERAHEIHAIIYDRCLTYYFQAEFKSKDLVSPIMYQQITHGLDISNEQYEQAIDDQQRLCDMMDEFMADYDILVSLSTAGVAPLRESSELPDPGLMWTLTYLPVVSVPALVSLDGLPFGVQLAARRCNDVLLFRFASYLRQLGFIPKGPNPNVSIESCVDAQEVHK